MKGMSIMTKLYKSKMDNEVYYYYLKNGEIRWMYRHKYYDTLGKRKEKKKSGFKTEKEALKSLLEVKASLLDGQIEHVENDNITVSKWVDTWYEIYSNNWAVTTKVLRKRVIEQQIKPLLGKYKLKRLDRTTYIREFINPQLEKYESGTVKAHHQVFTFAINSAVENEIIPRNRFTKIPIEKDDKLDNVLTAEELNIFLTGAKECLDIVGYTLVLLLAYTGMRHGEALGLKWKDINFTKNTITIKRTRDQYGVRKPKTKNSFRTIPVDELVIEQLNKYQKWCIKLKLRYGEQLDKTNDLVFISKRSTPCSHLFVHSAFERIYKQIKKKDIEINRITPHGLRHTHATILINNGIPPKTIAERLGNTVEMIYKVYSHSFKELEEKAVSIFSETVQFGAKFGA